MFDGLKNRAGFYAAVWSSLQARPVRVAPRVRSLSVIVRIAIAAYAAMTTNPVGAGSRPILAFIEVVPPAVEVRQRLRRDRGTVVVGAVSRRCAAYGESCGRRDGEGGGQADQRNCLEHGFIL